jgi:protein TonB
MTGARHPFEPRGIRYVRWSGAAALVVAGHLCGATLAAMYRPTEDAYDTSAGAMTIELAAVPLVSRDAREDIAHGPELDEAKRALLAAKEVRQEVDKELPRLDPSPLAPDPQVALPTPKPDEEKKPEEDQPQEEVPTQHRETQLSPVPFDTAPPPVDGRTASVSAAPSPGITASAAQAYETWTNSLFSYLNRYKRYPPRALKQGVHGEVKVQFTVDRTGRVLDSQIVSSSGSPDLDAEALAILQRASPLPLPPYEVTDDMLDLVLPIQFRIK